MGFKKIFLSFSILLLLPVVISLFLSHSPEMAVNYYRNQLVTSIRWAIAVDFGVLDDPEKPHWITMMDVERPSVKEEIANWDSTFPLGREQIAEEINKFYNNRLTRFFKKGTFVCGSMKEYLFILEECRLPVVFITEEELEEKLRRAGTPCKIPLLDEKPLNPTQSHYKAWRLARLVQLAQKQLNSFKKVD